MNKQYVPEAGTGSVNSGSPARCHWLAATGSKLPGNFLRCAWGFRPTMTIVDGCAAVRADVQPAIGLSPPAHRQNDTRHGPSPAETPSAVAAARTAATPCHGSPRAAAEPLRGSGRPVLRVPGSSWLLEVMPSLGNAL